MAIKERITFEELQLYEILRNPVLFGEFVNNYDKSERDEPFEFTFYQKEWLADFSEYMSICCSRAVGKTVYIVNLYVWYLVFNVFPNDYIVYGVPGKNHLETVWTGLIRSFRTNSFLKMFIAKNAGINSSENKITLLNQATLLCRIAGQTGTGVSFVSLHEPVIAFDESGYFPWTAFIEGQPTLNTFTQGHKMIVSGVPDGRREKSVCYHADEENSSYAKHRINSLQNPRFTEEDKRKAVEQYGGEDTEDYLHLVLGQHGKPVFSLFDRGLMNISNDPVYYMEINGTKIGNDISEYLNKLAMFPGIGDRKAKVIFGLDIGYTEPTAIIVLYLGEHNIMHFHGRIRLNQVSYPIQEKIIDYLDTKFDPVLMGIDKGNTGMGVIHHMMQDTAYYTKNYSKRIIPIDYSSDIILGQDENGADIKVDTKVFAVQVLQDFSNNHKIVYSHKDLEMITELERMTYSKTPSGHIVYKTLTMRGGQRGEDHFTASLLSGVLAYFLEYEYRLTQPQKKKLFRPMWL